MLFLIGLTNLINLLLARGGARSREVAIRVALGAGQRRLIGQFLTESLLVGITGGLLGLGLAYASIAFLRAVLPLGVLPREADVTIDVRVLLFTFGLSL